MLVVGGATSLLGRRRRRARGQRARLVPRAGGERRRALRRHARPACGTRLVVVGALMALVLIVRPSGITGGREFPVAMAAPLSRICVAGAGTIGSLLAAHLATRRGRLGAHAPRGARARAERARGSASRAAPTSPRACTASADPAQLEADLVILACKGSDLDAARAPPRGALRRRDRDDRAERARRRGGRRRAGRVAAALGGHVHERHAPRRHARRVHPRHGDVDRPVPRHDAGRRARRRGADRVLGPEGGGVRRPAPRAVVEADLQRDRERGRSAHRAAARPPLRRGAARRARARARRRGQGGSDARRASSSGRIRGR